METIPLNNQLPETAQSLPETPEENARRLLQLRIWQVSGGPTYGEIGQRFIPPISGSAAQKQIKSRRIRFARHAEFVAAGVPEHLLPPAQEIPVGRPLQERAVATA